MKRLTDKAIVIVGAATGIGAGTAVRLAQEGAAVLLADINVAGAERKAAEIRASGATAIAVHCDIADDRSVAEMVSAAKRAFGGFDGIHVNAADLSIIQDDLDVLGISMDVYDRTQLVDLRGHVLCTRHALPVLLERGGGAIVYTSSGAAFAGEPTRVAYGIAKAGLNALMRHVASRWGKERIRSNAVSPGLVLSETVFAKLSDEQRQFQLGETNSFRLGTPADLAAAVAFLMSSDGEWVNGQTITIDGGRIMR